MNNRIKSFRQSFTLILFLSTLFLSLLFFILAPKVNASTSADNFSFKSFTGDYFISKDESGLAKMHVKETLVAEFPNFNQNHGLRRIIPVTNQAGKNIVIPHPSDFKATVKRNGIIEPYTSSYEDRAITLKIGNGDVYVQGEQTYTIEYDFENVASFFEENNPNKFQEVYWNANGNAWSQTFDSVTANLHIDAALLPNLTTNHACYSGSYGDKNDCEVKATTDGYSFHTEHLSRKQGLTFVIAFTKDTFNIPPQRISYIAYFVFIGIIMISIITAIILVRRYYKKIYPKKHYYQNLLTPPEFLPLKGYTIAEAASLYLKIPQNSKVATALEMAIEHKIEIIKKESQKLFNNTKWAVKVLDTENLSPEQATLLKIFNNSQNLPKKDQVINLKSPGYSNTVTSLNQTFDRQVKNSLIRSQDLEPTSASSTTFNWKKLSPLVFSTLITICLALTYIAQQDWFNYTFGEYASLAVIENPTLLNISLSFLVPLYFILTINGALLGNKYLKYTNQGLEHANYLAGLETYIKMAEADRLRFLQSVDGVDTSDQGIVNLYEKLLPYAVIFGQEKTWLKSLERYYQAINQDLVTLPAWYAFSTSNYHSFNSSISRSTSLLGSSSGSGFSSGGGFSGGGGGGGGGGGW